MRGFFIIWESLIFLRNQNFFFQKRKSNKKSVEIRNRTRDSCMRCWCDVHSAGMYMISITHFSLSLLLFLSFLPRLPPIHEQRDLGCLTGFEWVGGLLCSVCMSESLGAHSDSRAVLPMCDSTLHELPVSGSACYLLLSCREP